MVRNIHAIMLTLTPSASPTRTAGCTSTRDDLVGQNTPYPRSKVTRCHRLKPACRAGKVVGVAVGVIVAVAVGVGVGPVGVAVGVNVAVAVGVAVGVGVGPPDSAVMRLFAGIVKVIV